MQAWRVHELGEPEAVLRLDDVELPVAGPGEVTIDVAASSLNFPDVLMCRGEYQVKPPLPFTPGAEVAGVVTTVGEGVDPGLVGRRVLAIPTFGHGGFTEQTLAPVGGVFAIPDSLGWHAAAALHVTYQTGHLALHRRGRAPARGDAARARGRGRRRIGRDPARPGRRRAGDRDGGRSGEGAGVPRSRRRSRDRLPRRRLRRRGEGARPTAGAPT